MLSSCNGYMEIGINLSQFQAFTQQEDQECLPQLSVKKLQASFSSIQILLNSTNNSFHDLYKQEKTLMYCCLFASRSYSPF